MEQCTSSRMNFCKIYKKIKRMSVWYQIRPHGVLSYSGANITNRCNFGLIFIENQTRYQSETGYMLYLVAVRHISFKVLTKLQKLRLYVYVLFLFREAIQTNIIIGIWNAFLGLTSTQFAAFSL